MITLSSQRLALRLANPFTLSYGTTTVRENVLVRLDHDGRTGVGEAAVVPYTGETPERVLRYLGDPVLRAALGGADPLRLEDALDALPPAESAAARAAVDIALHDLWGQALGQPLFRLWGLNPARSPRTSFTIAMTDDEQAFGEQVRAAAAFGLIKLKLGSGDLARDVATVRLAREQYAGPLCLDANGGWSADEALKAIPALAALEVRFVEQPVARDDWDGWRALRAGLPVGHPPLIADESVQGAESVPALAGLADGINVKLAKAGGLRPARHMITLARALGLRVLLGCMVETSVAVTAAAHLAPLADYVDLDGNLLITNDPYRGVRIEAGAVLLPDAPGLGVTPVAE